MMHDYELGHMQQLDSRKIEKSPRYVTAKHYKVQVHTHKFAFLNKIQ